MKRTLYCGELRVSHIGDTVVLVGWVHRRRDHGGLTFVDLRDREGLAQVVFSPQVSGPTHQAAHEIRSEFVIQIEGKVARRPVGTENKTLPTGEIEVIADQMTVLNRSVPLPFSIEDDSEVDESLRLKYRYLDMRRPSVYQRFVLRHTVARKVRHFLDQHRFIEVETPFLTKSTPEGARDFLVPSRLNTGTFYALPQSPQLFKQVLMVAGFDRYYQIVRCFRDEDLRTDRQPEFTQIDIEMSFMEQEEILALMEEMIVQIIQETKGVAIPRPFLRLTYKNAMERYGSDKPDLRFGLELKDLSDLAVRSEFKVFLDAISKGGKVGGINAKGLADLSRKEIDDLVQEAIRRGAKGLAWMKVTATGIDSPIAKFFKPTLLNEIAQRLDGMAGDILLFVADRPKKVHEVLGALRLTIAKRLNLMDSNELNLLWVTDFPLLEYDETEKRYVAIHHPFTAPLDEDLPHLTTHPLEARAKAYDMVMNGAEIGGGSLRNHQSDVQSKIFELLGIQKEEVTRQFGFLLEALQFGAPPHGGVAFGFDRLVAFLAGCDSIRDVIPFPKTQKGFCLMSGAPSSVGSAQLTELQIGLVEPVVK